MMRRGAHTLVIKLKIAHSTYLQTHRTWPQNGKYLVKQLEFIPVISSANLTRPAYNVCNCEQD